MRTSMTTLTQIWMTLLLSNILPSDHNSDLPLPKCQLVYTILTRMTVHVAQIIAKAIYLFAGTATTRHPFDPEKSNRALGFSALITGLCQFYGVPIIPSKVIGPSITRAFIEKYCTPRQAQGDTQQAADAPPPQQPDLVRPLSVEQYLRHMVCQQVANHRGQVQLHECFYRFNLSQQGQGSTPFVCPTLEQFRAEVAWPRDWPIEEEIRPVGSSGEAEEAHVNEDMTDLLGYLGPRLPHL